MIVENNKTKQYFYNNEAINVNNTLYLCGNDVYTIAQGETIAFLSLVATGYYQISIIQSGTSYVRPILVNDNNDPEIEKFFAGEEQEILNINTLSIDKLTCGFILNNATSNNIVVNFALLSKQPVIASSGGSGGNSHLYLHTIRYQSAKVVWNNFTNIMIYNNSSDKLGYAGLASWLYNNGFIDLKSLYSNVSGKVRNPSFTYVASAYQGPTNTGRFIFDIPSGVYSSDGVNIVLVYSSATNSTYTEITAIANPESGSGIIDELEQITQIM